MYTDVYRSCYLDLIGCNIFRVKKRKKKKLHIKISQISSFLKEILLQKQFNFLQSHFISFLSAKQ